MPHAVPKRAEAVNACQPINEPPHELLFQVSDFAGSGSTILPLAQVRCRWRDVAFSSPTLWSVIGACARLVPLFLQRSLGSPLQVRAVVHHNDSVIHHVVSFAVDFRARGSHVHELSTRLTYSTPAREHLSVIVQPYDTMSTLTNA